MRTLRSLSRPWKGAQKLTRLRLIVTTLAALPVVALALAAPASASTQISSGHHTPAFRSAADLPHLPSLGSLHLPRGTRLKLVQVGNAADADFSFIYFPTITTTQDLCLAINGSKKAEIANCTFAGGQLFHYGPEFKSGDGYYHFIDADGLCLAVSGGSEAAGAQVTGATCETGSAHEDQYWARAFFTGSVDCFVFNAKSGYVLEPASDSAGDLVHQEPWTEENNQLWLS